MSNCDNCCKIILHYEYDMEYVIFFFAKSVVKYEVVNDIGKEIAHCHQKLIIMYAVSETVNRISQWAISHLG